MSRQTNMPGRLRFLLSMLFVILIVVFAVGSWVGLNFKTVQERRTLRAQYNVAFSEIDAGSPDASLVTNTPRCRKWTSPTADAQLSIIRRWLGDEAARTIIVFNESDFDSVRAHFPESLVVLHDPPEGWVLSPDSPPIQTGIP